MISPPKAGNQTEKLFSICLFTKKFYKKEVFRLKHIVTINKANLKKSAENGGCGKCQSSCQSACKTSCTVANQKCESVK